MKFRLFLFSLLFISGCSHKKEKMHLSKIPHTSTSVFSTSDFDKITECKFSESGLILKERISDIWHSEELRMGVGKE